VNDAFFSENDFYLLFFTIAGLAILVCGLWFIVLDLRIRRAQKEATQLLDQTPARISHEILSRRISLSPAHARSGSRPLASKPNFSEPLHRH